MKLLNPLDQISFLPTAEGDVLCIHCQQPDNIHRQGNNPLIGCEPAGGIRLFMHAFELNGYATRPLEFVEIYYRAHAAIMDRETSH